VRLRSEPNEVPHVAHASASIGLSVPQVGHGQVASALPVLAGHPTPRELVSRAVTYNGNINAYLVEEVLDTQPPALRELILTTSVPDALTPELVEELTGEPAAPVTLSLVRANVFLEGTPGDESCLRYVPFFRDLVRAQLAFEAPERFRRLHRDVAAWCVARGRWEPAVAHLRAAGERPDCGTFLVDHLLVGRLLCEGRDGPLRQLVVTSQSAGAGASDHLLRAATALADGDGEGCASHVDAARDAGVDAGRGTVTAAVLEAVLAGLASDASGTERLAARAEEALAVHRRLADPGAEDTVAVLLLARAVAALRLGAVQRAERLLEAGLAAPTASWSTTYRCRLLAHAALLHARTAAGPRALAEAEEALAVARVGDPATALVTAAHLARAYAALAVGDLIGARSHLAETCVPVEPLWQVVHAVVASALERSDGGTGEAGARLAAVGGVAELAGPWAVHWVRDEEAGSSSVPAHPGDAIRHDGSEAPPGDAHPSPQSRDGTLVEPLTPRELEVLAAMSEWLTTEEIAEKLFVSVNTVRTHVRNILTKLGVSRRNAAIREAYRLGLLTSDGRPGPVPVPFRVAAGRDPDRLGEQ
jgi:LuxR family maltose regulon positive regulatory protein